MLNFLSLFSGCGGFDIGFLKNKFKCIGAYDNDSIAIKNYRKNIGEWIINNDLEKVNGNNLVKNGDRIDVVISGSPCQGYSTIGKRKIDDPRNSLLIKGGEIAINVNTRFFIAENVIGSLYGEHAGYWKKLHKLFHQNGYKTKIEIIDGLKIGMAQTRKRVFFFAWKGLGDFQLNIVTKKQHVIKEVLLNINGSMNNIGEEIKEEDPRIEIFNSIKPGQKLCDVRGGSRAVHSWEIPNYFGECSSKEIEVLLFLKEKRRQIRRRSFGDADPVSIDIITGKYGGETNTLIESLKQKNYIVEKERNHFDLKRSFNGKYRRLDWNKPSLTVDTNFGNPNYFLHPEENRGLTVREVARIQGFDDSYIFHGNIKQQFKLIGNAVPPPISQEVASNVLKFFIDEYGK